jgi:multicomponent Na+:H+ antiporter subunit E
VIDAVRETIHAVTNDASTPPASGSRQPVRAVIARAAMLFGLWIVLMQSAQPADLAVGALATIAATWASLRLLPPETGRVRFGRLLLLMPRFLWQSFKGGVDVAGRVFAPSLPLHTGVVDYRTGFPRGQARNNFATITSLMPGTLPAGDGPDSIEFHCLDTTQPITAQIAEEERLLAKALEPGERHG